MIRNSISILKYLQAFNYFFFVCLFCSDIFASNTVIIDINYLLDNALACKELKVKIEGINTQIQKFFEKKEKELKILEKELINKKNSLDEDKWNVELKKLNEKVNILKQDLQNRKNKLENFREQVMYKVNNEITLIINELSDKFNFDLVVNSNSVVFANDNINITNLVLEELNKRLKNFTIEPN